MLGTTQRIPYPWRLYYIRISECLELHLNSLSLEKWQENFLNKNFSAKFKKILRIERNIIVLDDETRDFLNITDGDIIKFDLSNRHYYKQV